MKNFKETWRQFTEAVKKKWKTTLIAATSAFLLSSMTSCTSAADKYQSGEIQLAIKEEKVKLKTEIEAYNKYFDLYQGFQKDLVALQAKGDIWGYQNVYKKSKELKETIIDLEETIDERADDILEYEQELNKGKSEFAAEQEEIDYAPASWKLKKRSFKEYDRFIH